MGVGYSCHNRVKICDKKIIKFINKKVNTKSYNLYYKLDKNVYYIYYNMVYDLDKNHKIINLRGNIMFKKAVSLMLVFSIIGFGKGIKVDALSKSNDDLLW